MDRAVDWPEPRRVGFALAAAACGNRGAARAAAGLCADVADEATGVAARLRQSDTATRRAWVRDVLQRRAELALDAEPAGPARAYALLAPSVDKQVGLRWSRGAPLPRAGYVADPRLLALLRSLLSRRPIRDHDAVPGAAWRA